ncbi:MAG TPA: threonine synthase [Acidobacteriota bacterium]|nr:threonine synthase [Acidobacteriota bacterium]
MRFYSTHGGAATTGFREAVLNGLAPDGGLYMPLTIPQLSPGFFEEARGMSFQKLSCRVAEALIGEDLPEAVLNSIVEEAMNFEVPVRRLEDGLWVIELFHGPTLAFKDFGARFMARLLSHFIAGEQELTILVATSGDTGSAVAHGFFDVSGVRVIVLYPAGRVSEIQEKQMATLGGNITALKVGGNFDDCQRLVKEAFQDSELRSRLRLTSANSINIARLIPQSFYYFYAWSRLESVKRPIVISVPSGNFGNLTAGLIAKRMGLPVYRFVAATNRNNVVPEYLSTGTFRPRPSIETISNAMDVGNPGNFARLQELYARNVVSMRTDLDACSFTDDQTRSAIADVYRTTGYILDPHGAVAYLGAREFLRRHGDGFEAAFLETAHPAKFLDVVESVLGIRPALPERLLACLSKPVLSVPMSNHFEDLKAWLLT